MFYSHELLTNRQYGVATIWLVATLGSKSNLKKVTRKAILDVDVPKACDRITDPDAPLALRLQGSLLYGVSRVYSQQCDYVLADMGNFREKMRGIAQVMKELEIDPDIGKTRPDQLNLPEDPAFFPDLDMGFDLAVFGLTSDTDTTRSSSILSDQSPRSSRTSLGPIVEELEEEPGIELPSMDTPDAYGGFNFPLGAGTSSAIKSGSKIGSRVGALDYFEESALHEDDLFDIDREGNIVEAGSTRPRDSVVPSLAGDSRAVSESGISARVRAEHEAGSADEPQLPGFDEDAIMFDADEDRRLPSAEPFDRPEPVDEPQPEEPAPRSSVQPSHESSTTTAEAPQQRVRQPKQLHVDDSVQLTNRQLGEWSTNYLTNMSTMIQQREQNKSAAQAKKNAAFWVLNQGIGGVELNFGDDVFPHPLSVFSGQNLLDALMGRDSSPAGSKRARSHDEDGDEDEDGGRRVRAKGSDEGQMARRAEQDMPGLDDDGVFAQDDDYQIESEIGRQAPSSLKDRSSAMPWNISSRAGSVQRHGSLGPGVSSSVGGAGGLAIGPPSLSRRASQLTSASPLIGKGRLPSLAIVDDLTSDYEEGIVHRDDDVGPGGAMDVGDDFELYGPSAAVDTQTAAQSQWLKSTLENEAYNFLNFLDTQIGERGLEIDNGEGITTVSITLAELLPPTHNTKVVGAQAMLHVLALKTKGLLEVEQDEAFGDIRMRVVQRRKKQADVDDDDEEIQVE